MSSAGGTERVSSAESADRGSGSFIANRADRASVSLFSGSSRRHQTAEYVAEIGQFVGTHFSR